MFRVTQEIAFCYGHRLLGHRGKCGRLHGHNGLLRVTLASERLDRQGMVADFDDVARRLRELVDEMLDHRMLLHRDDPVAEVLRGAGEPFLALDSSPTAENLARLVYDRARAAELPVSEVQLVEQQGSTATYAP